MDGNGLASGELFGELFKSGREFTFQQPGMSSPRRRLTLGRIRVSRKDVSETAFKSPRRRETFLKNELSEVNNKLEEANKQYQVSNICN